MSNENEQIAEVTENNEKLSKKAVKPKKKMVFAKNKKEGFLAIAVMAIFFANTAYMITKYYYENNAETQNLNPVKAPIELIKK